MFDESKGNRVFIPIKTLLEQMLIGACQVCQLRAYPAEKKDL